MRHPHAVGGGGLRSWGLGRDQSGRAGAARGSHTGCGVSWPEYWGWGSDEQAGEGGGPWCWGSGSPGTAQPCPEATSTRKMLSRCTVRSGQ